MRARFYPLECPPGQIPFVLDSYPVFLGIGDSGRLQVSEYASATRRCQIHLEHGTLVAIDLDSPEGTWVNGEPIERAPLLPGDKIHIGPCAVHGFLRTPDPSPAAGSAVPIP